MVRRLLLPLIALTFVVAYPYAQGAQETINQDVNARIRAEGMNNSQIMRTMHYITDVYGPRLTGSPNYENAAKWAVQQMESWGMTNGALEPFEFRTGAGIVPNGGWLNERASGHIVSPVKDNLVFEVLAWTPSTKGTVVADAVHLVTPTNPTREELDAYFASIASRVRGGIVLVGNHNRVALQEVAPNKRQSDEAMKARFGGAPAAPQGTAGRGGRGGVARGGRGAGAPAAAPAGPPRMTGGEVTAAVNEFLMTAGAGLRINDAGRMHGIIATFANNTYDHTKTVPTVVLRNEDYGRITRLIANGTPVRLEFTIVNNHYPAGTTSYNAVAEIPGTDKADEVVMLGGHFDSWHSATGATDNGIGSAIMMEAARILKAIGVQPRRTIRVALWGGEEQGLIGSQAYVREHFGTAENPKPAHAKFNGYFNIDSGTGRVRGFSVFGPPEAARIVGQYLREFEDFGIYGAIPSTSRSVGGTDHTAFNAAGLPGIGATQDPIEYGSHTWHTNLDTYERIVEDDVKKSAIAVASAVYHIAMREQMLPRFAPSEMPAAPGGRGGGTQPRP